MTGPRVLLGAALAVLCVEDSGAFLTPALCKGNAFLSTQQCSTQNGRARGLATGDWDARSTSSRASRGSRVGMSMMFDQLASAMSGVGDMLKGKKKVTANSVEGALKEVKRALLDADVNLKVTNDIVAAVKNKAVGTTLIEGVTPAQQFIKVMNDELVRVMGEKQSPLARREDEQPTVILLAGLQGAGKTTAAAKLTKFCQGGEKPRKVLMVAGDVYRPAAIEQLQTLALQVGSEVYTEGRDVSPVDIVTNGVQYAKDNGFNTVIVDTAGRQVVDDTLMKELVNVKTACKPDEILLVVDAMTGQEAATLTKVFNDKVGITGAVLTKMDGDNRGGAALSVQGVSGKPIKFCGVGEKVDALEPFFPERMASRILGMGDVVSLVEKAQKELSDKEAERLTKKMMDATFDFDDFRTQSRMMKNMGNMAGVARMMPGMAGQFSAKKLDEAEAKLARNEVVINSMTNTERKTPDLLTSDRTAFSRQRRIARGAGLPQKEVSQFVSEFETMRNMMANMSKQMMGGGVDPNKPMDGAMQQAMMESGNRSARRKKKKEPKGKGARPSKGFG